MPCSKQNISLVRGNRPVRGWGGGQRPSDFAMGTNCQRPVRKRGVGGGLRPSDFGDGY